MTVATCLRPSVGVHAHTSAGHSAVHSHQRSSFSESFKLSFQDIPLTTRPSWPPGDFLGSSLIRSRRPTLTCWRIWWLERRFSLTLWLNRFEPQSTWLSRPYFFLCFLSLTNIVWDQAERDVGLVRQLGLNLQFVLNTHVHADHITGTGERWNTSKLVHSPSYLSIKFKMIWRAFEATLAEHEVRDLQGERGKGRHLGLWGRHCQVWQQEKWSSSVLKLRLFFFRFGEEEVAVMATPGHTEGCVTYVHSKVFLCHLWFAVIQSAVIPKFVRILRQKVIILIARN